MARLHGSRSSDPKRAEMRAKNAPRKQPVQARSRTMVESILRATARILIRQSYAELTTNAVAEEAGASVGSLYQYFPSKESLVAALLERHLDRRLTLVHNELAELAVLPVERAMPRFVEAMLAQHQIDPELQRVFLEQLPRIGDFVRIDSSTSEIQRRIAEYLVAHAAEIGPQQHELTAFMLVQSVLAMIRAAAAQRPELLREPSFAAEVASMLIAHLRRDRAG